MSKWEEMTPEQRNALIHEKVMELPMQVACTGHITWKPDPFNNHPHGYWQCEYGHTGVFEDTAHMAAITIPNYTQSMDSAWLVVKHILKMQDGYFNIHASLQYPEVVFHPRRETEDEDKPPIIFYAKGLDTLPEAVCLTALCAVGVAIE